MGGDQAREVKLTPDQAKMLLIQEAPSPIDTFLHDPAALIRAHPREAMAIAAAVGVALTASAKFRRGAFDGLASAAKLFLK